MGTTAIRDFTGNLIGFSGLGFRVQGFSFGTGFGTTVFSATDRDFNGTMLVCVCLDFLDAVGAHWKPSWAEMTKRGTVSNEQGGSRQPHTPNLNLVQACSW